ncbi:U3 snoRNP protein [Allomyces arbusculus]|nr:U3 snoRNP protein [Allomyces arbusculus]
MSDGRDLNRNGGANRFKYRSFADRLKNVHIDVTRTAIGVRHEDDDAGSFFLGSLTQWEDLNCTAEFSSFLRQVRPLAQSLPMVLFHKRRIVDALVARLVPDAPLSLEPLLSLTANLAKDLRHELFEFLPEIVTALMPLLRVRDSDVIENTFQCIAYLLRYLQKDVLREIVSVFDMLAPFLGFGREQKPYIRQFAGESISYMIRRVKKDALPTVLRHILDSVDADGAGWRDYADGLAFLLSETVCHVNGTLHSSASVVLKLTIDAALANPSERKDAVIHSALHRIVHHASAQTAAPVFACLKAAWARDTDRMSQYLLTCIKTHDGDRVGDFGALLQTLCNDVCQVPSLTKASLDLVAHVMVKASYQQIIKNMNAIERIVLHGFVPVSLVIHFNVELLRVGYEGYSSLILPLVVRFLSSHASGLPFRTVVAFLAQVLSKATLSHSAASTCVSADDKLIVDQALPFFEPLSSWASPGDDETNALCVATISAMQHLALPRTAVQQHLVQFLGKTVGHSMLFSHTLNVLLELDMVNADVERFVESVALVECPYLFASLSSYLQRSGTIKRPTVEAWIEKLVPFVSSVCQPVRSAALAALAHLMPNDAAVARCSTIDAIANTMHDQREKVMNIKNLALQISKDMPARVLDIVVRFAIAVNATNFAPLWPHVKDLLTKLSQVAPIAYWNRISECLVQFQNNDSFSHVRSDFPVPGPSLDDDDEANEDSMDVDGSPAKAIVTVTNDLLAGHVRDVFALQLDRVDYWNTHLLVLKSLVDNPFSEAKSKFLVPLFLQFLRDEYSHYHPDLPVADAIEGIELGSTNLPFEPGHLLSLTHVIVTKKLVVFLELLAHFKPQHTYKADQLYPLYLALLVRGDAHLQKLALNCIHTYAALWYTPYHSLLVDLLEDNKFRDTLLSIKIDNSEDGTFKMAHRADIFPILTRVLYGRMLSRKGHMAQRRGNVLSLMAGAAPSEVQFLFDLMRPATLPPRTIDTSILEWVDDGKAAGFLALMDDVIKQVNRRIVPVLEPTLDIIVSLACASCLAVQAREREAMDVDGAEASDVTGDADEATADAEEKEDASDEPEKITLRRIRDIRSASLKRLVGLFNLGLPLDYSIYVDAMYQHVIAPRLAALFHENKSSVSPSLLLLTAWAVHQFDYFAATSTDALPYVVQCLTGFEPVRNHVLDLLFAVLEKKSTLLQPVSQDVFRIAATMISPKTVGTMARLIKLCSEMAPLIGAKDAPGLVTVLLPVLKARTLPETKDNVLRILQSCIQYLSKDDVTAVLQAISRLYAELETKASRQQLVALTHSVAKLLELPHVSKICRGLNTFSKRRMDEVDYDVVLTSFTDLAKVHADLTPVEWMPVLYNLFWYIKDEDLSARANSAHVLGLFAELAVTNEELRGMIQHVVYPALKKGLRVRHSELVRMEWTKVLVKCVTVLSTMDIFADMTILLPRDATDESGFFENVYHIQLHRRVRALGRLREHAHRIRPATLNHVFLSMMMHFLEHKDTNLVNDTVLTITAITKQLAWGSYYLVVRNFFNSLRRENEKAKEKVLIKALVGVLDAFHFQIDDVDDPLASAPLMRPAVAAPATVESKGLDAAAPAKDEPSLDDEEEPEEESAAEIEAREAEDQAAEEQEEAANAAALASADQKRKVFNTVLFKIIPELNRYLLSRKKADDETMSVRVPIALGITHLITWLPDAAKTIQVPALLTKLAQLLRARSQITRNQTRTTLIKILQVLGAKYLFFLIKELRSALLRGYQLHVLGFTVHAVLNSLELSPEHLDVCIDDLCQIVSDDIFGDVGQEKDAEAYIKSMKELKSTKSHETLEIMATHGSLQVLSKLLIEVKRILLVTRDAKLLDKANMALKRISVGMVKNETASLEELMKLAHTLIVENSASRLEAEAVKHAAWKTNAHHFVEFGLQVLMRCLRSDRISVRNTEHTAMLNALVDVVAECFTSKHNNTLVLATFVMQNLAPMPLSALKDALPLVMRDTFHTLASLQNVKSDLAQASLKLIYAVMRHCEYIPFTQTQVKALIRLLRPEIGDHDHHTITYSIVKSIMARQVVVNEVYELVLEIAQIMVTSQTQNVQDLCRSVYLMFLLTYPQGKQRMANHVTWMVKNLGYQFEQGRVSVLELMYSFVKKLPEEILAEHGELMFMGLVTRLADDSPKCQQMAAKVIQLLVSRFPAIGKIHKMVQSWYKTPATCLVATQVHGILILADNDLPEMMAEVVTILDAAAKEQEKEQEEDEMVLDLDQDEAPAGDWKLCYQAVLTLTKYVTRAPTQTDVDVVEVLKPHLLHPHVWIRLATSRCLGIYFAESPTMSVETLRHLAKAMGRQLTSQFLNPDLATQVVKNYFFLAKQLHAATPTAASDVALDGEAASDDDEPAKPAKGPVRPLMGVLRHLSFLARQDQARNKETLLRKSIFQIFAALINTFEPDATVAYLQPILAPIYRTMVDESTKGPQWDELRSFCQEIMDLLQMRIGNANFTKAYAEARSNSERTRQERRQKKAELAVTDPKAFAQRKLARNEAKKQLKKRKAEAGQASRMHDSVKRVKTGNKE